MDRLQLRIEPYANDYGRLGASLANLAEVMIPCLDAAAPASLVEVGAYAGDLTGLLLEWAAASQARVLAVDPDPQPELEQLARDRPALELLRETSLEALARIDTPDAVVIDGDHNYYTVSEELRLIGEKAASADLPLLLFHDVCWPHARRDDYFDPTLIPAPDRQPTTENGRVFPGEPAAGRAGLRYRWPAATEGGPQNGVLTAVEDFVSSREDVRLAIVPAFFGFAVIWHVDAPWADAVAGVLDPWDANPLLERLEGNRVFHLAAEHELRARAAEQDEREARKDEVLERLLASSAFSVAERLSRLRERVGFGRGQRVVSKDDVRSALRP